MSAKHLMWTEENLIYGSAIIGMALFGVPWLILTICYAQRWTHYLGILGTALAAIPIAGLWLDRLTPWIWGIYYVAFFGWMGSLILISSGLDTSFSQRWASLLARACCAVCLGLSGFALAIFLWLQCTLEGGV